MGRLYGDLDLGERVEVEKGLDAGESLRAIAARLGRAVSTVSREGKRGRWRAGNEMANRQPWRGQGYRYQGLSELEYRAGPAQRYAAKRAARSHQRRLFTSDEEVTYVVLRLGKGWTPAMIAGRGAREGHRMSHESIYAWIYSKEQRDRALWEKLRRGHKQRRHKHGRRVHSSHIPFRASIHDRPSEIDERTQFGHWEGDTVLGAKADKDGIHTEVERVSRFVMAVLVPDLTSATTAAAQLRMFAPLPAHAARSVTLDNGAENHLAYELDRLAMPVYYADPYSSWQRGTNEHHNGSIRCYIPKGSSLAGVSAEDLADIVAEINDRPMKLHGWDTPAEVFHRLCSDPHATVALPT